RMIDGEPMQVQLKVTNGTRAGQLIPINRPRFLIGRAEDCHLKPKSELISRYHCAILSEDGYVAARDLGSKNGVFVNGKRVSVEEELKNGDHLIIGPLDFEVVLSVALAAEKKKPKIETMQELVARTVEQSPKADSASASSTDLADWLMEDDANPAAGTKTIQADQLAELGLTPDSDEEDVLSQLIDTPDSQAGKKPAKPSDVTVTHKAPEPKPVAPPLQADPDTAANALKNFFQE
ncbi:MAG: FHA domain-containing protein, partial [Thermoguttaceae bacterium]|nr:FHA domain-containing protein [Thermoguttaceae bacterium]